MHADEFMIRLCLEILLQFTHEEEKELHVKQNNVKQFFSKVIYATPYPSQNILHKWFLLYAH